MHQEHAPRVRAPAPSQATTVRLTRLPLSLPLSPTSLCVCARVSTPGAPHTPRLSLPRHGATEVAHATQYGAGHDCPAPTRPPSAHPARASRAHANKPTPKA